MNYRYLRLLTLPALGPADRLVWSRLARAARYEKGMTISRLAKDLGLNRTSEIPSSLKRLEAVSLAEKHDGLWYAKEPADGTFVKLNVPGVWQDRIHYIKVLLPSTECPVNIKVMVLHALMLYLNTKTKANYTTSNLARLLVIDRKTVRRWLKELLDNALITKEGKKYTWQAPRHEWMRPADEVPMEAASNHDYVI